MGRISRSPKPAEKLRSIYYTWPRTRWQNVGKSLTSNEPLQRNYQIQCIHINTDLSVFTLVFIYEHITIASTALAPL